jgi:hypothetical protein
MILNNFFQYGERVDGYDVLVLNEREARAAAGILFALGIISFTNAMMLGHSIVTRIFIAFFTLDFVMRVIQPRYSPSLLLGRVFVQNQIPEYVGAAQKRFAWGIGLLLALPMFYLLVIHWQPNPIKMLICVICLTLLFLESAFSICIGCKLYELFSKNSASHCPGGVCEIRVKDPIQTFSTTQKLIATITSLALVVGIYAYTVKVESKTKIGGLIDYMLLSDEQKVAKEEAMYEEASKDFEEDDDF